MWSPAMIEKYKNDHHGTIPRLTRAPSAVDNPVDYLRASTETGTPVQPALPQQLNIQRSFGSDLVNFAKVFTDDMKYSGEDDHFDYKLSVFHDVCERIGITLLNRVKVYPTLLKGPALDHYYTYVAAKAKATGTCLTITSLDDVTSATRAYFEGPEFQRRQISVWSTLSLAAIKG